jgi:hypothetical protein
LALDSPENLRRQLYGRTVVFHLAEAKESYQQALASKDFVQEVKLVEGKLIVTLDDPEKHNPELIRVLIEKGAEIRFVGELRRKLEDVYLHFVNASSESEDKNEHR